MRDELVSHVAPVHEAILRLARAARVRRQADGAVQPQPRARLVELERGPVEIVTQHGADPFGQGLRLEAPLGPPVVLKGEHDPGPRERDAPERFLAVRIFGPLRLEELAARRRIEVQVAHFDARARGKRRRSGFRNLGAAGGHRPSVLVARAAAGQLHARDGGDAGQRFTPETQARYLLEVREAGDLAGSVARKRELQLVAGNARTVVRDLDQLGAPARELDRDLACAGIEAVFEQFLEGGGGAVDDFAGGDLAYQ